MKLFIPSFLIVFFISFTGFGQVKQDTVVAFQYYQKADTLLTNRKFEESILFYTKALPIYEKAKAWERVVICYNKIATGNRRFGKLKKSFQNSEKALEICKSYLGKGNQQEANSYDGIGIYYEKISNYDQALVFYEKALSIRKKLFPEEHADISQSYQNVALVYYYTASYKKSLYHFEKALKIDLKIFGTEHSRIGSLYNNIGGIQEALGEYTKALEYNKKFLDFTIKKYNKSHRYVGYTYINMGISYMKLLQYDNALHYLMSAMPILLDKKDDYGLGLLYTNLGNVLSYKGQLDQSKQYLKKSLDINTRVYGENYITNAGSYLNLGTVSLEESKDEEALLYFKKALSILNSLFGENHPEIARTYLNIGAVYLNKKQYTIALENYKKALTIFTTIFETDNYEIADLYLRIGTTYYEMKSYDDAIKHYEKGLKIIQNYYGKNHTITSEFFLRIANTYNKQKKFKQALVYYDKAFLTNTKKEIIIKDTFDPNHYQDIKTLLETQYSKGNALQLRYQQNGLKEDLTQSAGLYAQMDLTVNQLRNSFYNYQDKVTFARLVKEVYTDAITMNLLAYKDTRELQYLEAAWFYMEKSKSNTLKELLADTDAKAISGLSEEIIEMEKTSRTDRAFYQSKIIEAQSTTEIDSLKIKELENKLFTVSRKQDSIRQVLESNYPKYYQLKHESNVITVSEIQEKLDNKTTVLEFFTADRTAYAFIISKNKFSVKELPTPKLTEKVETFRKATISKDIVSYKQLGNELYNTLIQPIQEELVGDELIIIPDGSLWHLNFELLLTKEEVSETPRELSYLLRDYSITYANSATLLFNPFQQKERAEKQEGCLAFSFSDSTQVATSKNISLATLRAAGDDLPGTRKEIRAISEIVDGQYYFGAEADEAAFKKNASRYKILHLALHGEVDNERPENSKLYFTKGKDTIEDNLLYSHELFALDIPAELTVLSACNTGTGKIAKGEGIMSLGNAFQYAGTKSLLLSSWEVPDETAPQLMQYFYTNLKDGMNKSKALQQAKLAYLNTTDIYHTSPFYWGGFYLVGDAAPINFGTVAYWYWVFGLGVLVLLILGVFFYKKTNKHTV